MPDLCLAVSRRTSPPHDPAATSGQLPNPGHLRPLEDLVASGLLGLHGLALLLPTTSKARTAGV